MKITYKDAGVDTKKAGNAISALKGLIASTSDENVMDGIGSFGSMYSYGDNVLVSGTDGVGTKLMLAKELDNYKSIGNDLVGMCVNDILCHGAKPMFFLDYMAMGELKEERYSEVITSIVNACKQAKVSLVGGESAEMPGMYSEDEIDLAGFCVGTVSKERLITGRSIREGDILIGAHSNGFHSNGFSLIRKIIELYPGEMENYKSDLLAPTMLYTDLVMALMDEITIKGIAHITGGGFFENIPRMIPDGLIFEIKKELLNTPNIFNVVCDLANLDTVDAYSTFNMGYGMVFAVDKSDVDKLITLAEELGYPSDVIGEIKTGSENIII